MTSYEMTEWMAYFSIKESILNPKQPASVLQMLRAAFSGRIKKKNV
jgi:hypothetical protein